MTARKLVRIVFQSIRRNKRDFVFSSIGIVIGISTLLFFTALGAGIRTVVLEEVFVITELEVEKKSYEMGMFKTGSLFGGDKLDDDMVERLSEIEGVASVYPKMKLTFPAAARGGKELLGRDMWAEFIGDGIPTRLVADELEGDYAFQDWEAPISCGSDEACPGGFTCGAEGVCEARSCTPDEAAGVCTGYSYCQEADEKCEMPIPVVISPQMLEIYNGSIHTALSGAKGGLSKLPRLSQGALIGFEFRVLFGRSFIGQSAQSGTRERRVRVVGFSDKALKLGATMPIDYVRRLNEEYSGREEAGSEYHSIVVRTKSNEAVANVARTITDDLGLALSDEYEDAQRAGLLILLITLVFNLIGLIILTIAAVNIMHTFLMMVLERRRELGLMRALGATRAEIRLMVLGEATVLGLIGGVIGVVVGWLASLGVDWLFATQVRDFPFKPESLFVFEVWMYGAALGVSLVFCWLGALLPSFRASSIDPAAALTGR